MLIVYVSVGGTERETKRERGREGGREREKEKRTFQALVSFLVMIGRFIAPLANELQWTEGVAK